MSNEEPLDPPNALDEELDEAELDEVSGGLASPADATSVGGSGSSAGLQSTTRVPAESGAVFGFAGTGAAAPADITGRALRRVVRPPHKSDSGDA